MSVRELLAPYRRLSPALGGDPIRQLSDAAKTQQERQWLNDQREDVWKYGMKYGIHHTNTTEIPRIVAEAEKHYFGRGFTAGVSAGFAMDDYVVLSRDELKKGNIKPLDSGNNISNLVQSEVIEHTDFKLDQKLKSENYGKRIMKATTAAAIGPNDVFLNRKPPDIRGMVPVLKVNEKGRAVERKNVPKGEFVNTVIADLGLDVPATFSAKKPSKAASKAAYESSMNAIVHVRKPPKRLAIEPEPRVQEVFSPPRRGGRRRSAPSTPSRHVIQ